MISTEDKKFFKDIKKSLVIYLVSAIFSLIGGFGIFTISQYSKLNLIQQSVDRLEKKIEKLEDKFLYSQNK